MQLTSCSHFDSKSTGHDFRTLGLSEAARFRLAILSGVAPTVAWQPGPKQGAGKWRAVTDLAPLLKSSPLLITTTWRAPDPDNEAHALHLADGIWIDIDASPKRGETITDAIGAACKTRNLLKALDIDPETCSLFASGGKGWHVYVPLGLLIERGATSADLALARNFPAVCKLFVSTVLMTELTDRMIYCRGQGRLLKQAGVERENGLYKVPMRWSELDRIETTEQYRELCAAPRSWVPATPVQRIAPKAARTWVRLFAAVVADAGGVL